MSDSLQDFLDGLAKCGKFLPAGEGFPMEVVVLRGHLLIEEQLKLLVQSSFVQPDAYDIRRTKFSEALRLARALHGGKIKDWEWDAIGELGVIRNSLAHHFGDDTFEPRIRRLFQRFMREDPTYQYVEKDDDVRYNQEVCK